MFVRRQGTALILLAALSLPEVSSRAEEANGQGGLYRGPGRSPTRGELLALLAGGSLGPPGTPPDFECAWRTLAADFAAALQPWRPPAAAAAVRAALGGVEGGAAMAAHVVDHEGGQGALYYAAEVGVLACTCAAAS